MIAGLAAETAPKGSYCSHRIYTPTPISLLFSKLLGALAVSIEAERDIEDVDACDPSIDHWLRDAERAWATVSEIGATLCAAQLRRETDRPLVAMVQIMNALMEAQSQGEFDAAQKRLSLMSCHPTISGHGATERRITQMLRQCHVHLNTMIGMESYQPAVDPCLQSDDLPKVWRDAA